MIRLFNVYYPVRTLVLLAVEAMVVFTSFLLGVVLAFPDEKYIVLNYQGGYFKILVATVVVLICSHGFDLYDATRFDAKGELYFRLFLVPGLLALLLAGIGFAFPNALPGNNASVIALVILTLGLFGWRTAYGWLIQQPYMQEKVYVLGTGEQARRLVQGLRQRRELGVEVIGWSGNVEGALTRETAADHLMELAKAHRVHRVIVAMPDRRGTIPVQELLQLRLNGVSIEEATSWLEKISGRIEVEQLYPSWLIFAEGFRFSSSFNLMRRALSTLMSLTLLLVVLPFLPFVILAIKLDSRGPVLYRQKRVGRAGHTFYCYKFRTMRQDAEADTGPTWAGDDDPRITRIGKLLRSSRIDEIPQLWCVFKGDMAFVGPRPERPEFVEWLTKEIPYYGVRHAVRPGITGWAQIRYKYGNTVEDAKQKLQYDLFYIKNASLGLDILIMLQTIKIVLLGRGAQ
ncbi:MAG TPA: TIGR03013 family XrtA/PEP-CTERM system glycosyltransferase [Terriglobales bacterium]|nr:TIGR03013 family XrtA/PEP-CTERM system glycosyltransferase [Terriglobales bacterium]